MGIVYEAVQHGTNGFVKRVALKVVKQSYADQRPFIENLIGEAKLVADLIHTNIVQTYHLGESQGTYFITMELIRGANLEQFSRQLVSRHMVLPVDLAVFIASRVARGLAYAHAKTDKDGQALRIVHRDVSFKNILIAYEGDVKLVDFGVAKARGFLPEEEGEVIAGMAEYMSPEQVEFKVTDQRSDLFSTGVVLAHLMLGYNIFKGESMVESVRNVLSLPIPDFCQLDARINERLNQILQRTLEREISQRYQKADDLLFDLEHYIYHKGYGPTNETLGRFMRDLFNQTGARIPNVAPGGTQLLERTARLALHP